MACVAHDCTVVQEFRELLEYDRAMGSPLDIVDDVEAQFEEEHAATCDYCKHETQKALPDRQVSERCMIVRRFRKMAHGLDIKTLALWEDAHYDACLYCQTAGEGV